MIELKKISKSFDSKRVLQDISFVIYPDELTFIVGTSGAGKTTLLNIIGGLSEPDSGELIVDGENVLEHPSDYRADSVGFIFQDYNLISGLNVKDNLLIGQYIAGKTDNTDGETVSNLLNGLGLNQIRQKAETLSGGEKQRAAFARSILKGSRVIIADEPTGNLDSDNGNRVLDILAKNKAGRHIVVVSHDMEKACKYADRIIEIRDGNVFGDSRESNTYSLENSPAEVQHHSMRAKLKAINMLGKNSIRRRWGKILSTVLVIGLAISALSMVITIRGWGSSLTTRVNKYYLETDLINITKTVKNVSLYSDGYYPFSDSDLSILRDDYRDALIVPEYYVTADQSFMIGSGSNVTNITLKQIQLNKQFEERILSYDLEGRFPQNDLEIIISSDVSERVFSGNGIGETVSLYSPGGATENFTVVGINKTVTPFDSIYTIVSADALKSMSEEETRARIAETLVLTEATDAGFSSGGLRGNLQVADAAEPILVGTPLKSENEILISSFLAESVFGTDWKYNFDAMAAKEYWLDLNGRRTVHICGVVDSDGLELKCTQSLMDSLQKVNPVSVDIYLPDNFDTAAVFREINAGDVYFCTYSLEKLKNQVSGQTDFYQLSILIVGVILTLISVALLNSFSKITVLERRRELGIVKSLGADNKDLMAVLFYDSAVIAISSIILSAGLTFIGNSIVKRAFGNLEYIDYSYPSETVLLLGGIFAVMIFLCTALYFIKVARKTPSELLTDK